MDINLNYDDRRLSLFAEQPPPLYSMLRSSPLVVVLAVMLGCLVNFAEPDLWLHVLVGRVIISIDHIPRYDSYSYSAFGLPWHNHEWLAQVVCGAAYQWLGVIGLKLVKVACVAVTMSAIAAGLSVTRGAATIQRFVLLAVAAALIGSFQVLPQLFTFAMFSILMSTLAVEVYRGPVRLWPLVPMFVLWANFHAGCAIGIAALACCSAVLGIREFAAGQRLRRSTALATLALLCTAATLLNPFGFGLWRIFLHSVSDPLTETFVHDWIPLAIFFERLWRAGDPQVIQFALPLALFGGFAASLLLAPVLDDAPLVAIALLFMVGAFYAERNVPLAIIAMSIPLAHHIGLALSRLAPSFCDHRSMRTNPSAALLAAFCLTLALAGGLFSNRLKTWAQVPSGAVEFMKANGLHGNILNSLDWGEYLIWHVTPESRVFIDGRYYLVYPDVVLRDYLAFLFGWPGGEKLLERYPHDFVLVAPESGGCRFTAADPRWKLIYRDSTSVLFARSSTAIRAHALNAPNARAHWSFP
jgi:hypothetical protein